MNANTNFNSYRVGITGLLCATFAVALLSLTATVFPSVAGNQKEAAYYGLSSLQQVRDACVYVEIGEKANWGSGLAFRANNDKVFVVTCAHLFRHSRVKRHDFSKHKFVVKTKRYKGPNDDFEFITSECELLRADITYDLALLYVKDPKFPAHRLKFNLHGPLHLGPKLSCLTLRLVRGCGGL